MKSIREVINNFLNPFQPENETTSGFYIFKEKEGNDFRWVGWATNKWKDREEEIITNNGHFEFKEWLDNHPELTPELWIWHTPGTACKNKADFYDYTDGFFVYSGKLTPEEAKRFENVEFELGMSHGFFVLEKEGNLIKKYRTFEVSVLPLDYAANPFTKFTTIFNSEKEKKEKMFSPEKRAFLVQQLGEEKVLELEKETESRKDILEKLGVEWKEFLESENVSEDTVQEEKNLAEEKEAGDEFEQLKAAYTDLSEKFENVSKELGRVVEQTIKEVVSVINMEELNNVLIDLSERVAKLETLMLEMEGKYEEVDETIKALQETTDEKLAKALSPKAPFTWGKSVQQEPSKDTVEEIQKQREKLNWFLNK